MKKVMCSLLGAGLGGIFVPIIRGAFEQSIDAGIYTIFSATCLCVAAMYFSAKAKE